MMKKTTILTSFKNENRDWYILDAEKNTIGQIATTASKLLMGKYKSDFTPHTDSGAYVVIINAEKVNVTGEKEFKKKYYTHSGYLGGLKEQSLEVVRKKNPTKILERAITGMLKKTRHRGDRLKRLKITVGDKHNYVAQNPQPYTC